MLTIGGSVGSGGGNVLHYISCSCSRRRVKRDDDEGKERLEAYVDSF